MRNAIDMYKLLKRYETGMCLEKNELIAYVHLPFGAIQELTEIIGIDYFAEGGAEEVILFDTTLLVQLNDIFEYLGLYFSYYFDCFDEDSDTKRMFKQLVKNKEKVIND